MFRGNVLGSVLSCWQCPKLFHRSSLCIMVFPLVSLPNFNSSGSFPKLPPRARSMHGWWQITSCPSCWQTKSTRGRSKTSTASSLSSKGQQVVDANMVAANSFQKLWGAHSREAATRRDDVGSIFRYRNLSCLVCQDMFSCLLLTDASCGSVLFSRNSLAFVQGYL